MRTVLHRGSSAFGRMLFTVPPPPQDVQQHVSVRASLVPTVNAAAVDTVHVATAFSHKRIVSVDVSAVLHVATSEAGIRRIPVDVRGTLHVATSATNKAAPHVDVTNTIHVASPLSSGVVYKVNVENLVYVDSALFGINTTLGVPSLDPTAETWAINLATQAASQFDDFGFNSFGFDGQDYWACAEDGLYVIEGTTDIDTPIPMLIQTGALNLGVEAKKSVPSVWTSVANDAPMELTVETLQGTYTYTSGYDTRLQNQRFDVGLGLRAVYFTFTLASSANVLLDGIKLKPYVHSRRLP